MKRLALITVILGSALALVPMASAVVLLDGGSSGSVAAVAPTTDPAIQAVLLREKLAAQNGTAATQAVELRSQGLSNYYNSATGTAATQAVKLRSQGLSNYYSANGTTFKTDVLGGKGNPASTSVSTGGSFDWGNVLAVTLAGMLLLAITATAMTRRRHQPSF